MLTRSNSETTCGYLSMPLWSIKIVTNLKDGRSLLFVAIDHAVGDGVSLLSVFLSLFDDNDDHDDDTAPVGSTPVLQKERKTPKGLSLSHRAIAVLKGIRAGTVDTLVPPPSDKQNSLMVPKDKLTAPGFGKDFAQTRAFPIEEMKLMKSKMEGVTMNDMIMAILTMTVRRYLEQKGDTEGLNLVKRGKGTIRAVFPVNMRSGVVNKANVGNDFCLGYLPFGMDYKDSVDSVWKTKTLVDELKMSPAFALAKKVNDVVMPISPDWMLAKLLLDVNNRTTCMISNVVGPETSASIGGNTINDLNFTTAFGNSLYFGVLSFAGKLRISAVLDQKTGSDVVDLIKCCEDSYDELKAVLDNVLEDEPLKRPDMTPLSAKLLELLVVAAVIALPVFVASKMF